MPDETGPRLAQPGLVRRLAEVSAFKSGCLAAVVGALAFLGWAALHNILFPAFPLMVFGPAFFLAGAAPILLIRGLVAVGDRMRRGSRREDS